MKKLKKVLIALVLGITLFTGIKVNALTNDEINIIWKDISGVRTHLTYDYFEEGTTLPSSGVLQYACYENADVQYIVDAKYQGDYMYEALYKVPENIFEKIIFERFDVNQDYIAKYFKSNFASTGASMVKNLDYTIENDEGYYYFTTLGGWGFIGIHELRGYKDLGNSNYQFYFYWAEPENDYMDYELPENPVEGIDYVMREEYGQLVRYIILNEETVKVYFDGEKTKILSYLPVEREDIPSNEELIIPELEIEKEEENIAFLEGANQKFDASKDKNLTFRIDAEFNLFDKVYINSKEVDSKNYAASEGSTVITFNDEYTKSLKNGKYDLKVTFTDGTSTETTFTIANSVDNTSTGLYTSLGILTTLGILGCAIVFINTRKHSKFPQV